MFEKQRSSHWMLLCYCLLAINVGFIFSHPAVASDKSDALSNDADLMEDDRSFENALINYLFAKQFLSRQRHQNDLRDLQQKRSYWKQCAFNAVSCFG